MCMQSTSSVLLAINNTQFFYNKARFCGITSTRTRYGVPGNVGCQHTPPTCKCFADLNASVAVQQAVKAAVEGVAEQDGQNSTMHRSSFFPIASQRRQPYQLLLPRPVQWADRARLETFKPAHIRILTTLGAFLRISSRRSTYDTFTQVLAAASVLPALVLAIQPLVAVNSSIEVSAAAAGALMSAEWQGPLRDMFSFTVLLSVFIICEPGAAVSAAVCATGGALALLMGPATPPLAATAAATLLAAAAAVIMLSAASMRSRSSSSSTGDRYAFGGQALVAIFGSIGRCLPPVLQPGVVMMKVQQALGVFGGGLLLQLLICSWPSSLVGPASAAAAAPGVIWLSHVSAGGAAVMLAARLTAHHRSSNKQLQQLCDDWPAWSATLLLILQPMHQLVCSALDPSRVLPSISAWQQLLLVFASGLMVPRALLLGELMWFTGTGSGAMLAAGQLAVLAVHRATGGDRAAGVVVLVVVLVGVLQFLRAGWRNMAQT